MAYIPLTAPQGGGGFEPISDAISEILDRKRQRSMDRAALLKDKDEKDRRGRIDYQQAYIVAQSMLKKGDVAGAKALMAPFTKELREAQEGGPPGPEPEKFGPPAAPSPMGAPPAPMAPGPVMPPDVGPPDPKMEAMTEMGPPPGPPPGAGMPPMPPMEGPPPPPMMGQPAQAPSQNEQRARTLLRFRDPDGNEQSMDPEAAVANAMAQKAQMLDSAFAGVTDPEIQKMYAEARPIIMSSPEPVDPSDLFRQLKNQQMADRQEANQQRQHEETLRREDVRAKEWDRRYPIEEAGRRERSLMAQGPREAAVGQGAERLDLAKSGEARQIAKDAMTALKFTEEQVRNRKFNSLAAQLGQDNAALDAATAGTWIKEAQGGTGVISEPDKVFFWDKIGGVTTRTGQWVQDVLDGKIEPGKRAKVEGAVRWLAKRAQSNLNEIRNAVRFGLESSKVPEFTEQIMGTYFSDERNKIEKARAASKAAKTGAAPGRKSVDDRLNGIFAGKDEGDE